MTALLIVLRIVAALAGIAGPYLGSKGKVAEGSALAAGGAVVLSQLKPLQRKPKKTP